MDRYCGNRGYDGIGDEIKIQLDGSSSFDGIIVIFKTDLIMGGRGFKFSWEST
jgi:hypothetical protein